MSETVIRHRKPFCHTARAIQRLNVMFWKHANGWRDCTSVTSFDERWHLRSRGEFGSLEG